MFRDELRFAHYSVKEYLVSTRISSGVICSFSISERPAHQLVARISLIYLLFFSKPKNPAQLERMLKEFTFLEYAARHWHRHFHSASDVEETQIPEQYLAIKLFDPTTSCLLNSHRVYDPDPPYRESSHRNWTFPPPLYYSSLLGFVNVTEWLLDWGADVNAQGGYYGNALQAASVRGHEAVVRLLLDRGVDVNTQGGYDVNAQGGFYGNALKAASVRGHEAVVRLLLDKGADINTQAGHYGNALQAASYSGNEAVVQLLLDKGADINAQGGYYGNALQAA
jgi:hypothetical protein